MSVIFKPDGTVPDGSITQAKLNGSINASLDLADTAVQPAALANYQPLATVLTNTTAAFTTAQETKLAGIAAGAEVNVNADWNAVSGDAQILNKPTLGTAAATNSTDYATSAQGAKADTAVQPAAIGSTILAYDANLQTFVNTFTLPTTDGTSGQSLVTNGAGALSFATVSGGDPAYIAGVAMQFTEPLGGFDYFA